MSRQEFEQLYAEKSGTTVEFLQGIGLVAVPCDCGEDGCMGWQMQHQPTARRPSASEEMEDAQWKS